jgi:hypothetical protein
MNIQNLVKNWKTTSAGITSIALAVIHLVYSLKSGTSTEATWEAAIAGILVGVGLLFAGDASQSADAGQVATIQRQMAAVPTAIDTGNTEQLKKTVTENQQAPNTNLPAQQPPKIN